MWYYAINVASFNLSDQNNLASQARNWSYSAHFKMINICLPQKALGYHSLEVQQLVTAQQLCMLQPRGPQQLCMSVQTVGRNIISSATKNLLQTVASMNRQASGEYQVY